ncbi:MAG: malate dehydrogenase (quinone) [Rhodoluna sp.]|nr:malate dehydrogenase (quinone) [Rhodoluna sp.]MBP6186233.1 malate dehydrogenase (quinone) [Rhodoluna sp.]
MSKLERVDVALVGGGIMSATLGTFLRLLEPKFKISIYERLERVALESSNPWNNAGTGHAALCELNYMPDSKDGSLPDPSKAIQINEQFQLSRQFWAFLVTNKVIKNPSSFIHSTPHMTFVQGEKDVDYLRRRAEVLAKQPLFKGFEFTTDHKTIEKWAPLLIEGRTPGDKIAATRIDSGTDVDFGSLTEQLFDYLAANKSRVQTNSEVISITRVNEGWHLVIKDMVTKKKRYVISKFVFVGAGGWALKLLQSSGIPEAKGYGLFPVSGSFLRTDNPELVKKHQAKVYSQASVGAPPMSVPHLDTRVVDGKTSLLFGPYAGAIPKFLKQGSLLDLPKAIKPSNIRPYLSVALKNLSLIQYLVGELAKTKTAQFDSLRNFVPNAKPEDWSLIVAGQRAQVIKRDAKGNGNLQFGTEVVTSEDGSIAGLLGASPGASTSVHIMLEVLEKSFASQMPDWQKQLQKMIPSLGKSLNEDKKLAAEVMQRTARTLGLKA